MGVITALEEPSGVVSAYAPNIFKLIGEDTPKTTGRIKAFVSVDYGDGRLILLDTIIREMYRNTETFVFDISEVLKDAVEFDFPSESSTKLLAGEQRSIVLVSVQFRDYDIVSGVLTHQGGSITKTYYACNTIPDDRTETSLSSMVMTNGSQNEFLTRQKTQYIFKDEQLQLHFIHNDSGNEPIDAKIRKYNSAGSLTGTDTVAVTTHDKHTCLFYGEETDPLTTEPTMAASDSTVVVERVTGSTGEEYIGVKVPDTKFCQWNNTEVGSTLKFEAFCLGASGNITVTFNGTASSDVLTTVQGWNTYETIAIPVGTTAIRITNNTGETLYISYADTVEASYGGTYQL
jgi:hypothetical protein